MSEDDELKILLNHSLNSGNSSRVPTVPRRDSANRVIHRIHRQQSQKDLVNFGFLKVWSVLLEMMSIFYVRVKEQQRNNDHKPMKMKSGDANEF